MSDPLLPCPFCGDDGDKGVQHVTQMVEGRPSFNRITCRACGAMCPEENWNHRAPTGAAPTDTQRLDWLLANCSHFPLSHINRDWRVSRDAVDEAMTTWIGQP